MKAFQIEGAPFPVPAVLVASDLSAAADRAVSAAAQIADAGGAELHVVCAFSPQGDGSNPSPQVVEEAKQALPAQLRRVLVGRAAPMSAEVRFGPPAAVILQRAAEIHAGLVVVGPHRGTDVQAQYLGTVTDDVLREATIPCLIVSGILTLPPRTILLPVLPSEGVTSPLLHARTFRSWVEDRSLAADSARNVVLHIAEGETENLEDLQRELETTIGESEEENPEAYVVAATDPAEGILDQAERRDADLIVLATRRKGRSQGSQLGSVSAAVARRAHCPVLLIPPGD